MKPWSLLAVAVFVPGGCLIALGVWLRRRWLARAAVSVDALIVPPVPRFEGHDDSLRLQSERRRAAVEDKKRQAAQIASGQPVESRIRIVGQR